MDLMCVSVCVCVCVCVNGHGHYWVVYNCSMCV